MRERKSPIKILGSEGLLLVKIVSNTFLETTLATLLEMGSVYYYKYTKGKGLFNSPALVDFSIPQGANGDLVQHPIGTLGITSDVKGRKVYGLPAIKLKNIKSKLAHMA